VASFDLNNLINIISGDNKVVGVAGQGDGSGGSKVYGTIFSKAVGEAKIIGVPLFTTSSVEKALASASRSVPLTILAPLLTVKDTFVLERDLWWHRCRYRKPVW